MGVVGRLRALDDRVLPRLGYAIRAVRGGGRPRNVSTLAILAGVLAVMAGVTLVGGLGEPSGAPGARPNLLVGVHDGQLISEYAAASAVELRRLAGDTATAASPIFALVSFSAYLTPAQVAAEVAVAGPQLMPLVAIARIPLPRRQTTVVSLPVVQLPGDLVNQLATEAATKRTAARDHTSLADQAVDGPTRQHYQYLAEVDAAEAAAYADPKCACVFGLVVRGAPAVLIRLSRGAGVRVVDAAPDATSLRSTTFRAALPEQTIAAPPPDDELNPSLSSTSVSSATGR